MQFVVYDICNYFLYTLATASVLIVFSLRICWMTLDCSFGSEEKVFHKKMIKYLSITLVILIALAGCIYIFRNLHTPDIVFLREFI